MSVVFDHKIQKLVEFDSTYDYTPDLPSLRYKDRIEIFLWDDLAQPKNIPPCLPMGEDFDKQSGHAFTSAVTADKFAPWYSLDDKDLYQGYCLEEADDRCFIELLDVDTLTQEPLPLVGTVISVSLHVLCELDEYYENECRFSRVELPVFVGPSAKQTRKCFAWVNTVDQLVSDDDPSYTHCPLKSYIDVTPFRMQTFKNNPVYSF